jgi:hypothetical protein
MIAVSRFKIKPSIFTISPFDESKQQYKSAKEARNNWGWDLMRVIDNLILL